MKKKLARLLLIVVIIFGLTGCTHTLTDKNKQVVKNPETGQSLTENILCKPTDKETIKVYEENDIDISKLPDCDNFSVTTGGYEGLWTNIFVKPLAWVIIQIGKIINNYGLALILTSLIIRLIVFPLTRKSAMQSELIKEAQKDLNKIEKKYENKNDQESLMKKSQEMTLVYKKHGINPMSGCLVAFIQLPLFIAFFEAINRIPAIFEDKLLTMQLGTTPWIGISSGNLVYLLLIIIIAATTYFSFKFTTADTVGSTNPQANSMKKMPIIMTIMIVIMGMFMTSAIGLYWVTTNLFTVVQNILVKRSREKNAKK
jgi:YidC/Oxa1 family membrane protein insertase